MRSSILGVGTELTDGQIVNKNASWLAKKCKALGLRSEWHLAVPDDRAKILQALRLCESESDVIFVTGGLGPTSDDFTRELISQWTGEPLEFHEPSWIMVQERLKSRGYVVHDFQRQQCFFPRGSVVLPNSQGTANAFRLHARGKEFIVLPGPPREIEAIWNEHLIEWLKELTRNEDPIETKAWQLIGLGESQVAAMMEPLVAGHEVEVGYRIHMPYVEFKIGFPRSRRPVELLAKAEQTLAPWTLTQDEDDIAEAFVRALPVGEEIQIIDPVTGSVLLRRLGGLFFENKTAPRSFLSQKAEATQGLCLSLTDLGSFQVKLRFERNGHSEEEILEAPMKAASLEERRRQYFAEMAMAWWLLRLRGEPRKPRPASPSIA